MHLLHFPHTGPLSPLWFWQSSSSPAECCLSLFWVLKRLTFSTSWWLTFYTHVYTHTYMSYGLECHTVIVNDNIMGVARLNIHAHKCTDTQAHIDMQVEWLDAGVSLNVNHKTEIWKRWRRTLQTDRLGLFVKTFLFAHVGADVTHSYTGNAHLNKTSYK